MTADDRSDTNEELRTELRNIQTELTRLQSRVDSIENQLETENPSANTKTVTPEKETQNTDSATAAVETTGSGSTKTESTDNKKSHPNIEFELGIKALGFAGGTALVVATVFLVQLAISRGYIGPLARVLIATSVGLGMLVGGRYLTWNETLTPWGRIISGAGFPIAYIAIFGSYASSAYRAAIGTPFELMLGSITVLTAATAIEASYRRNQHLTTLAVLFGWVTVGATLWNGAVFPMRGYFVGMLSGVVLLVWKRPWTGPLAISIIPAYVFLYILFEQLNITAEWIVAISILALFVVATVAIELRRNADPVEANTPTTTNLIQPLNLLGASIFLQLTVVDSEMLLGVSYIAIGATLTAVFFVATEIRQKDAIPEPYLAFLAIGGGLATAGDEFALITGITVLAIAALITATQLSNSRLEVAGHIAASATFLYSLIVVYASTGFSILPFDVETVRALLCGFLVVAYYTIAGTMQTTSLIRDRNIPTMSRNLSMLYSWIGTIVLVLLCEIVLSGYLLSSAWGIIGFSSIVVGSRYSLTQLRIQGMTLLGITTLKVFVVDTAGLDPVPRILSLVVLGTILLITSYFYTKTQTEFSLSLRQG